MPIRSLLSETSFNSDQTEMIAKAFDDAWAELQSGQSEPAMSSLVRTALAKRIIEVAQRDGMTVKTPTVEAVLLICRKEKPRAGGTARRRRFATDSSRTTFLKTGEDDGRAQRVYF